MTVSHKLSFNMEGIIDPHPLVHKDNYGSLERCVNRYTLLDEDTHFERLSTLFPQDSEVAVQAQISKNKLRKEFNGTNKEKIRRKDGRGHGKKERKRKQWQ